MRKIAGAIGLGITLSAGCLVAAVGANAAPAQPRSLYAPSALVLTVGQGEDASTAAIQRAVTLSCAPRPSGTHPAAAEACAELSAADGDFSTLATTESAPGRVCTRDWRPVTVTAEGVWDGRRVSYAHTFPNNCVKEGAASLVFEF
ncbi:hypothetical protein ACZ90_29850 [Streptomyces albus subsp. albus]|nr:hypothetical protein ACZ90_29850 [Streptomyces albus subsp. albus]